MIIQHFFISKIPALLYGEPSDRVFLYLHGQCGCKEDAERFAQAACQNQWQVASVAFPGYGERSQEQAVWEPEEILSELQDVMHELSEKWSKVALAACGLGAWFSLIAFANQPLQKILLISPILDLHSLAGAQKKSSQITGDFLPSDILQSLPDSFWEFAKKYAALPTPHAPTALIFGRQDSLTSFDAVESFVSKTHAKLTVLEEAGHRLSTPMELLLLDLWIQEQIR